MITFSRLGNYGHLGNQMFQYALLKGVAAKNNLVYALPKQNHHLFECFDIKCKVYDLDESKDVISKMKIHLEKKFNYNETVFTCGDNTDYSGYYQTEKYFSFIKNEIEKDFTFKQEIRNSSYEIYKSIKKERHLVSLHVRRGDYVNLQQYHPLCTIEYYQEALKSLSGCDIVCFSDDIQWCKNNLNRISQSIFYCESNNPYIDMCLMSMCDHNIIANSSFSWWGAWLNKNPDKIVTAPKKWVGPSLHINTDDVVPKNWRKI